MRYSTLLIVAIALMLPVGARTQTSLPLPLPVTALFGGTPEEQAACRPDVRRLCRGLPREEMVMLHCLKDHREKLTGACRTVLHNHGQ